jgi:hypothetical protein
MRELKQTSDLRCPICRATLFTPTVHEKDSILKNDDEKLSIVLEIDPGDGPHPVLWASFDEATEGDQAPTARIPRRILGVCGGLLTEGRWLSD